MTGGSVDWGVKSYNGQASWRFSLFFWGGRVNLGEHSVEDHYLYKKWNFTG